MRITVEKPNERTVDEMKRCPTWEKEASVFEWTYGDAETCLLLDGEVTVTTPDGETVAFGAGDLVTFPAGLRCTWDIRKPVRKHYRMG